ncbi:leucine-rich repeat domain-containing protein [Wolbachia endosymbiont of Pentidionis agamae]|uniref:hypothetical protein n=1 Tax=Wolbachia endosymbiont of Pentidionis agamae TaxID=3110435 RepID=UPI002FD073D4
MSNEIIERKHTEFNNEISDRFKSSLSDLAKVIKKCKKLNHLNLSLNEEVNYYEIFNAMENIISIRILNVRGISDECLKALAKPIKNLLNLEEINLSNNEIGDEGVEALASALKGCKNIKKINLSNNKFGDNGLKALVPILKDGDLESKKLNLYGNKNITNKVVEHLCKTLKKEFWSLKTLCEYVVRKEVIGIETLDLGGTKVDENFIHSHILPHLSKTCKVHYKGKTYNGHIDYSSLVEVYCAILTSAFALPFLISLVSIHLFFDIPNCSISEQLITVTIFLGGFTLGCLMAYCVDGFLKYYSKNHCNVSTELESPSVTANDCNAKIREIVN